MKYEEVLDFRPYKRMLNMYYVGGHSNDVQPNL